MLIVLVLVLVLRGRWCAALTAWHGSSLCLCAANPSSSPFLHFLLLAAFLHSISLFVRGWGGRALSIPLFTFTSSEEKSQVQAYLTGNQLSLNFLPKGHVEFPPMNVEWRKWHHIAIVHQKHLILVRTVAWVGTV